MKRILLASACALAFVSPACADVSATLSGQYFNLQGPGWQQSDFRLTGVGAVPLGMSNLSLQGSAEYEYAGSGGFDWSEGTFAITPFWTGDNVRAALSVGR